MVLFTVSGIRNFLGCSRQLATLNGHKGPVVTIDISPKGDLLASGGRSLGENPRICILQVAGNDGVKIWDLKTLTEVPVPEQAAYRRAQISSVHWITRKNEPFNTLVYGNALGFLVFL